jgi:murein DD-endopeptidase MepM/ murein hydrolase activator NlpD
MRERNDDDPTPNDDDSPSANEQPTMSRRALRLAAEEQKIAEIARRRELDRMQEQAVRRADEIRRDREAALAREEEHGRHLENIRQSQPLPTLPADAMEHRTAASNSAIGTGMPSYAERGHIGAQRKIRADQKAAKAKPTAPKSRAKPAYLKIKGIGRSLVVLIVAGLTVVMALPATGFNSSATLADASKAKHAQTVDAAAGSDQAAVISLGDFAVTSYASVLAQKYGTYTGGWSYSVTNSGPIRWPFPGVVPISSGFGSRVAPCLSCSSFHEGMDFDPDEGTPFFSVADGVVTEVHDDTWGLGKWVVIHHKVGKLEFDSLYAHMLRDSTGVKVGDVVKAGDYVGRVGNSGTSTGPHLHFEIHLDGKPVDPFPWLKKHTVGNH